MPTPDSIDRGAPGTSATDSFFANLGVRGDQTVFINPLTRQAVQADDPVQVAQLLSKGFERHIVPQADWGAFRTALGPNLTRLSADGSVEAIPVTPQAPLSAGEQAQLDAGFSNTNASAGAAAQNLDAAFAISQPGRDRAALTTKQDYGASVIPTQAAAAFNGAGYAQANHELYRGRLQRDRTLAGLADQNTSAQFQLDVGRQSIEQQRQEALRKIYADALANSQTRFNSGVDQTLAWIK